MMILPRSWLNKPMHDDMFTTRLADAVRDAKPMSNPRVMGIFERQTVTDRRKAAFKAVASRMGSKFAEKLFKKDSP